MKIILSIIIISSLMSQDTDSKFKRFLSKLDINDPKSINKSIEYLESVEYIKKTDFFFEFMSFYEIVRSSQTTRLHEKYGSLHYNINDIEQIEISLLSTNGFVIEPVEETYYIHEKAGFLKSLSKKYALFELQMFNQLQDEERQKPRQHAEGSLEISFNEVFNRLKNWEKFKHDYPTFQRINIVERYINDYTEYLCGQFFWWFEGEEMTHMPDYQINAYETYLTSTPNSESYQKILQYYQKLKNNKFRVSRD